MNRTFPGGFAAIVAFSIPLVAVSQADAQRHYPRSPLPKPIQIRRQPIPKHITKIHRNPVIDKLKPKFVSSFRPDLYFAGAGDLTDITDRRPMSQKMWFRIGNKGKTTAKNFTVAVYFYHIVKGPDGKPRGKITQTRYYGVSRLKPGAIRTFYPHKSSNPPSGIRYAVKVDRSNRVRESREDNNKSGRMWTTYPDAFLRQIPFDPVP